MFKFLHAADLHLDSPLMQLSKYPGAPVDRIRLATREALANLVRCALAENVAFVLISGDIYDGDWDDYNTGHYFNMQMMRLANAEIPVYLISGNHDAANKMTRALQLPGNVHAFPSDSPATVQVPRLPVTLHGQGFATASVKQDLSLNYPPPEPGRFNIGLLHTSVDGREGHANYAPCTLGGLIAKGYDYWALGHIHQREILHEARPMVAFPGNIQGRHIRETGAKGCLVVEVGDDRQIAAHRFHTLDTFRWEVCRVDLSQAENEGHIRESIVEALSELVGLTDGRPVAVRVHLAGGCAMHDELFARQVAWTEQIRAAALEQGGEKLWVEKVKFQTTPLKSLRDRAELDGPIEELSACVREWIADEEKLLRISESFNDLKRRIPAEVLQGDDGIDLDNLNWLRDTLLDVEKLVVGRLLTQEEAP